MYVSWFQFLIRNIWIRISSLIFNLYGLFIYLFLEITIWFLMIIFLYIIIKFIFIII